MALSRPGRPVSASGAPGHRRAERARLSPAGTDRFVLARTGSMRVPGVVFASPALLRDVEEEALRQLANVATLPGVVDTVFAMPDVHSGYGFPIGGVAATDVANGGVVSPGGVGFDISCGVRLLLAPLSRVEFAPRRDAVMDALDRAIPRGLTREGVWRLEGPGELDAVLRRGAAAAVAAGFGLQQDLAHCEDNGEIAGAVPGELSARARERGIAQVGSLGSGNHFLEIQFVEEIYDEPSARAFGLVTDQVCVMIHCGSRGLGHQVCTDHVRAMIPAMARRGISVPDRQLACAPVESPEGQAYLRAMAAAANYGRANRQVLTAATRRAFRAALGMGALELYYDVSHNLAKLETHVVDGERRLLCVHRKGATLALPPGHLALPPALRAFGQPVFVPGSMGTASYVLAGEDPGGAFSSTCHGSGRVLSRHAAVRAVHGAELRRELEAAGIAVRAPSARGLAEEAPLAYKDVDEVVATCVRVGLARRVARLRPLGVIKG